MELLGKKDLTKKILLCMLFIVIFSNMVFCSEDYDDYSTDREDRSVEMAIGIGIVLLIWFSGTVITLPILGSLGPVSISVLMLLIAMCLDDWVITEEEDKLTPIVGMSMVIVFFVAGGGLIGKNK